MSEKLCALRKAGGGTLKETVLWTNPSPTSTFSAQQITLNQNIDNFKQVAIYFRYTTTNAKQAYYIYDVDLFKTFINGNGNIFLAGMCMMINGLTFSRSISYVDSTHVWASGCWQVGGSDSQNPYIVPIKIVGLK